VIVYSVAWSAQFYHRSTTCINLSNDDGKQVRQKTQQFGSKFVLFFFIVALREKIITRRNKTPKMISTKLQLSYLVILAIIVSEKKETRSILTVRVLPVELF
jgi:hypothetical protein